MATIPLGRYLWERIHQVGVDTIFGVPGDFNLQFLDYIFQVKGLKWVGNQNELNAAYAADGYAKVKGVPGAVVTTHGVGELSALNGVAGAMSEHVKMIHVVGQTTRTMQDKHMMIHHSIGREPDHQQFNRASRGLRFAAAELWDVKTAPAEIDRVIRECFIQSGPVYVFLPLDLSQEQVSAEPLKTPINISPDVDFEAQSRALSALESAVSSAKTPCIFIDALVQRFGATQEARDLVDKMHIPFFCANMGKAVVDEDHEMYVGVFNGEVGTPGVKEACRQSDLVLLLGYLPADTNSGGFSRKLKTEQCVEINPFDVVIKGEKYPNTHIKPLLSALIKQLPSIPQHTIPKPQLPPQQKPLDVDAKHLTQSYLWPAIEKFLRPHDILVGETGTTVFGLCDITFPPHTRFITQIYYGSIGYATPAFLGADIAKHELVASRNTSAGRTILITGDGSLALTIQEVGTMIRYGVKGVMFVLNNQGYTVERMIWGAQQPYNDIADTSYQYLLPLFKHPSPSTSYHRAATKAELDDVLKKKEIQDPPSLQLVELVVPKLDTAWRLGAQLAVRGEESRKYLEREGFVDSKGNWGLDDIKEGFVAWK